MIPPPDPAHLAMHAAKYELFALMRRAHTRGEPEPPRAVLRRLARTFPGSLSELETMELDEIEDRAAKLRLAARGQAAILPWMIWSWAFHRALRAALIVRRIDLRTRPRKREAGRLARSLRAATALPIDDTFVAAARRPPKGRLVELVLARVSAWCEADPDEVARAILPRRRRPRNKKN